MIALVIETLLEQIRKRVTIHCPVGRLAFYAVVEYNA